MKQASRFALFAVAVLAAACGDSAVAPRSQATQAPSYSKGGWKGGLTSNSVQFTFTVDPTKGVTILLGAGNAVEIPANTICDPSTTNYGVGTWDMPCQAAAAPITFTVTVGIDRRGHPAVNFNPDVRFAPTLDPARFAHIVFSDAVAAANPAFDILYCRPKNGSSSAQCIDEALTDPALVTVRDPVTGKLGRRIKHFSGYNVAAGVDCSATPNDPSCSSGTGAVSMDLVGAGQGDDGWLTRIGDSKVSGFMLASGRSQ